MANFAFPDTVYDQPQNLLATLGRWWSDYYAGAEQVAAIVASKAQVEAQTMLDLMETIAAMSRFDVPIYHTDNWFPLYLRHSERNDAQTSLLRYGEANYGEGHQYDVPVARPSHAFPLPDGLKEAPLILNAFVEPSLTYHQQLDHILTDDAIIFRNNPFEDTRIVKRPVYQDGVIVDTEAVLWVYRGQFDWDTIYRQFGYVLGIRLQSSTGYRDIMNAVFDAFVGGMTKQDMLNAMSAITGVPFVREAEEVVEDVSADSQNLLIITDAHVYKFDLAATPLVAVGDTVTKGQPLTDAVTLHEFNTGVVPTGLAAMALGRGFLSTCFYADLVFENKEVPINVITDDPSGYTKLTWDLGGFPGDVERFFDDMHARGVAAAMQPVDECAESQTISYPADDCEDVAIIARKGTIAHFLDRRAQSVNEPKASHLPRTINPLKFLIQNVLRNNAFALKVKISACNFCGYKNSAAGCGIGLHNIRILRKVVPAHTAMILIVELTPATDSVTVEQFSESLETFTGMEPLADAVELVSDTRVTARIIAGNCQ